MAPASLTRSVSILERNTRLPDDTLVIFDRPVDDPSDPGEPRTVALARSDWLDFGSPAEITVTIEAGDQLNPGG